MIIVLSSLEKETDMIIAMRLLLVAVFMSLDKNTAERTLEVVDVLISDIKNSGRFEDPEYLLELFGMYRSLLVGGQPPSDWIGFIQSR